MKERKWLFSLCTAGIVATAASLGQGQEQGQTAENPANMENTSWAHVQIPYAELKSLWKASEERSKSHLQPAEPDPPVGGALISANYELVIENDQAVMTAQYVARTLTDHWQMIPLLGGEARLEQGETSQGHVLWHDERYQLLTKGEGDIAVKLRLAVPAPSEWDQDRPGLRLLPGLASLNRLRISGIPEGKMVRIPGLTPSARGEHSVTYHLAGKDRELLLELDDYKPAVPPAPSRWSIRPEILVHFKEGKLFYESKIQCQADTGSGLAMELLLPHNAQSVAFTGEDLKDGTLGRRENGVRPLQLRWQTRDVLERELTLSYQMTQSPLSIRWLLQAPRAETTDESLSLYAILMEDGLQLKGQNLKDSIESRRLPEWLRDRIGPHDFLTAEAGHEYELEVSWLPRLETSQAMVTLADYQTRLVADGALLVQAQYTIQHRAPLNWRLELPEVDEILTCEINERPAQPMNRGKGEIEFALGSPMKGPSKVAFCYAARVEALDPVSGRMALELPRTDLFINQLNWELSIPEIYTTTAIEGNVTINADPAEQENTKGHAEGVIRLEKELIRGDSPAVEIYYQRRGLND